MKVVLILRLLRWPLLLAQVSMRAGAGTKEDVWMCAEDYDMISQTLKNIVSAEKSLNRHYLRERSEDWFQNWKTEVHRSAVYQGYLGCNPEQVLHVISLIRSKLESDALTCMDNTLAEYEDIHNESFEVSRSAKKLAQFLERRADLESDHFDAILDCLADPQSTPRNGQYAPPRIRRVALTAPTIISNRRRSQISLQESRRSCFDFHTLEHYGTTADIVYLFEECVRGDIKDWVNWEYGPALNDLQTFFKVILRDAFTRPAEFKRSLLGTFDKAIQMIITTVRKSHVAQSIELIENYENRNRSAPQCRFYLPRLKTLQSDMIRGAYRCLHGTYMNYLDSQKLIELDADDINRLMTNSTHQTIDLQRANITVPDAVYHLQNKVLPTYNSAKKKGIEMERQYANDLLNIKTHQENAFQCVQNTQNNFDEASLELSRAYTKCPSRITKQKDLLKRLEPDYPSNVLLRIDTLFSAALSDALQVLEKSRNSLESFLTITAKTTPICQANCATKAYAQIKRLHEESQLKCTQHLTKVKTQLKDATRKSEFFQKLILNGSEEDLAQQCRRHLILLTDPTPESFQIDPENCGVEFASHRDSQSIIDDFRQCFKLNCFQTWRYIFLNVGEDDESVRNIL